MHHHGVGRDFAHGSDEPHLRDGVDGDVGQRVGLASHVAGLGGEIENDLDAFAKNAHVGQADIGGDEFDFRIGEIGQIGAAAEQEGVDRRHPRAAPGERDAQIRAEEPRPAGHQDALAAEVANLRLRLNRHERTAIAITDPPAGRDRSRSQWVTMRKAALSSGCTGATSEAAPGRLDNSLRCTIISGRSKLFQ